MNIAKFIIFSNELSALTTDRQNDKLQIYNLSQIGPDRKWLQDILLSDTETEPEPSDEDEYIRDMLREHVKEKKVRAKYYQNPHVRLFINFHLFTLFQLTFLFTEFTIWLLRRKHSIECRHVSRSSE